MVLGLLIAGGLVAVFFAAAQCSLWFGSPSKSGISKAVREFYREHPEGYVKVPMLDGGYEYLGPLGFRLANPPIDDEDDEEERT